MESNTMIISPLHSRPATWYCVLHILRTKLSDYPSVACGIFRLAFDKDKGKGFHTCYWVLGSELIPMYRQSARRWLKVIHQAVGCHHYFPPGLRLPSQPQSITAPWPVQSYTAWRQEAYRCEQLAQGCYAASARVARPVDCKSNATATTNIPLLLHMVLQASLYNKI